MKTLKHPTLRAALGVVVLFIMWQAASASAGWTVGSGGMPAGLLLLAALAALCGILCRRVHNEVNAEEMAAKAVRAEADLCRERVARHRADAALVEADQLLARISGRVAGGMRQDPVGQLGLVQDELMQMQRGAADPAVAARIEMLRTRLELVAKAVRQTARTAEAG